ncbi:hypothetical protein [Pseudonocardia sp. ICBG601]|uniref:hypothetical protein n=1 Tax=Pseudonocardia sp. ICBG601 TaxID=2846759 RepID=UPI0035AC0C18
MSTRTVRVLAGLLRGHRRRIGTRWRRLTPARQALLVLALRKIRSSPSQAGQLVTAIQTLMITTT